MPNHMMVMAADDKFRFDADAFARAAADFWAPFVDVHRDKHEPDSAWWAVVDEPKTPTLIMYTTTDGSYMKIEGTDLQMLEGLIFACTLIPEQPPGPVWAMDTFATGHAELRHGMTAEEIVHAWVNDDEDGPVGSSVPPATSGE